MNTEAASEKNGFYSAADLAALKLPNFPTTDRAARTRAESEGWEFIEVKSRGKTGKTRKFKPPPEIMAMIEKRLQGELPPAEPKSHKGEAPPVIFDQLSQSARYHVAEPGPADANMEINAHLLWLCHDACLQVHGEEFARQNVRVQIDYAVDLYNLLLRLSAAKRANARSNPRDFNRLDAEDMGSQLKLFVQMGWVKIFPPPPVPPNQIIF